MYFVAIPASHLPGCTDDKSDRVAGPASQEEVELRNKGGSNVPTLTTTSGNGVSRTSSEWDSIGVKAVASCSMHLATGNHTETINRDVAAASP